MDALSMICVIPARSGSKRLPGKNFLPYNNTLLFMHTIKQAEHLHIPILVIGDSGWSREDVNLVHSTKAIYKNRSPRLDGDEVATWDVVRAEVKIKSDMAILQVTSPLRSIDDIKSAIDLFETSGKAVTSTCGGKPNGAIYVRHYDDMETDDWIGYEMPKERSLDIDTIKDYNSLTAATHVSSQTGAGIVPVRNARRGGFFLE